MESLAAGGYGFPAPASLFLGTVFLAAGMGPTWGTEASGQAAVWGAVVSGIRDKMVQTLCLVLLSH